MSRASLPPKVPPSTFQYLLARACDVLVGAAASSVYTSIRTQLSPLYGAAHSILIVIFIPITIFPIVHLLTPYFPSIFFILPLLFLPALHNAHVPLITLCLLVMVVAIYSTNSKIHSASVVSITTLLAVHISFIHNALQNFTALPAANFLVALVSTCLSFNAAWHRVLASGLSPKPLRQHQHQHQHQPESGPVVNRSTTIRRRRGRSSNVTTFNRQMNSESKETHLNLSNFVGTLTAAALTFAVALAVITITTSFLSRTVRAASRQRMPSDYVILSQTWSATGLVSVVEKRLSHRMLVADRSVLGGYFVMPNHEPDAIFSQFYVHEAVRLANRTHQPSKNGAMGEPVGGRNGHTLCIGVGVGIVTNALRMLGSSVDAVELDPAVASASTRWFGLHGGVHVADGRSFIRKSGKGIYDYVIHDAFTGGGISASLVSEKEFRAIKHCMKADGVFAINVVSGMSGLSAGVVLVVFDRLLNVFGHVRMFGDGLDDDINNVVLFASAVAEGVQFRKARKKDFLGSTIRQKMLESFEEKEIFRENLSPSTINMIGEINNSGSPNLLQEMHLRVGLFLVAWRHANVMDKVHPKTMWPALLSAAAAP